MHGQSKRLRILAGPNGSGKSTVVKKIKSTYYCGPYVNADEIQTAFDTKKVLNLSAEYDLITSSGSFDFYLQHEGQSWIEKARMEQAAVNLRYSENNLIIPLDKPTGDYDAAIAADFVRYQLLGGESTFTFETVLSHRSKLQFMDQAKMLGYKNYLYFVCTVDPAINLDRIAQRVQLKGHDVPRDKVVRRYEESLKLLQDLIPLTYRTFLFDNSVENSEISVIGEIENGTIFKPNTEEFPWWVVDYVLQPLFPNF
jgi:predicted ABC-type ATPase